MKNQNCNKNKMGEIKPQIQNKGTTASFFGKTKNIYFANLNII